MTQRVSTTRLCLMFSVFISPAVSEAAGSGWRLSSVDFDQGASLEGHEADSLENNLGDAADREPEWSEAEVRSTKKFALGLSGGEALPGASYGVSGMMIKNDVEALIITAASGQRSYSGQSGSGKSLARKLTLSQLSVGFEKWPAPHFPFSFVLAGGVAAAHGRAKTLSGETYDYKFGLVSAGADIIMESVFESGLWLRWSLLSARHYHTVTKDYGQLDSESRSLVASDAEGMKITGFVNITAGFLF